MKDTESLHYKIYLFLLIYKQINIYHKWYDSDGRAISNYWWTLLLLLLRLLLWLLLMNYFLQVSLIINEKQDNISIHLAEEWLSRKKWTRFKKRERKKKKERERKRVISKKKLVS